jgi:uncharacterized protein with von Willebrand factor type A (vWA) domain
MDWADGTDGLQDRIVEFCRLARASGFNAGVKETIDALESASLVGVAERASLKSALRAVLCSSKEEWDRFDGIFEQFWSPGGHTKPAQSASDSGAESDDAQSDDARGLDETRNQDTISYYSGEAGEAGNAATVQEGKSVTGASLLERMRKIDFSVVPRSDLQDLERLAQRLLEHMCLRLSRRLRIETDGRVDLRRTIRASIGRGGDPVDLRLLGRKKRQPRLVIFIDVSGSMELYTLFLLRFAFALHKHFRRARTFIFSTRPIEVTEPLNVRRLDKALKLLGAMPAGWSGGTRIGDSLAELNRLGGPGLLSRDTIFIIFSDGLDTGEPEKLGTEMQAIKRRVKRVVWLNPLAGMQNYQPLARGMRAALPSVDLLAAANNLDSLLRLEKALVQGSLA